MPVSIVLPAYNEQEAIAGTIAEIRHVLEQSGVTGWEIILVDDGSTDDTARLGEQAGARIVRHLQKLGYGRSIKDGIAAAKHDDIAILDADGTYPVERLPVLVSKFREGYHMVIGHRTGKEYRKSLVRSPLRLALKWLVEFTTGRWIPDVNSGFRVFDRREVIAHFPRLCDTFSFTTSLTLAYLMQGRFVTYVPIEYKPRIGKSKVLLFRDTLRTLQYIVQAVLYYNPIKLFLILAGLAVGMAVAGVAFILLFGFSAPVVFGLSGMLVAVLIVSLGLVADLLRQISNK